MHSHVLWFWADKLSKLTCKIIENFEFHTKKNFNSETFIFFSHFKNELMTHELFCSYLNYHYRTTKIKTLGKWWYIRRAWESFDRHTRNVRVSSKFWGRCSSSSRSGTCLWAANISRTSRTECKKRKLIFRNCLSMATTSGWVSFKCFREET